MHEKFIRFARSANFISKLHSSGRSATDNLNSSSTAGAYRRLRFANLVPTLNSGGRSATVRFSIPPFDAVNRAGGISIWKIQEWFYMSRLTTFSVTDPQFGSTFLEINGFSSMFYYFAASLRTVVNESLYGLLDGLKTPRLSFTNHLSYVGNASFSFVEVLSDETSGSVFAENEIQFVLVDSKTRKPVAVPDWWMNKYKSFVEENQKLVIPTFPVPNENTFTHYMKPSWNDTDDYGHINFVRYPIFCFDAAMEAIQNRFYANFSDDILKHNVKTTESSYRGESNAGDSLAVKTWQNSKNPLLLHFSIEKNEKIIYQTSVEFFQDT